MEWSACRSFMLAGVFDGVVFREGALLSPWPLSLALGLRGSGAPVTGVQRLNVSGRCSRRSGRPGAPWRRRVHRHRAAGRGVEGGWSILFNGEFGDTQGRSVSGGGGRTLEVRTALHIQLLQLWRRCSPAAALENWNFQNIWFSGMSSGFGGGGAARFGAM